MSPQTVTNSHRSPHSQSPRILLSYGNEATPEVRGSKSSKKACVKVIAAGRRVACEQAHLFGEFVRDNLGGESRDLRGGERSEPARGMGRGKVSLHEFRPCPCEVTSLNCQGIKYLTNTSEAKCKQTRLGQAVTAKSLSTCTGPNSFQYHRKICIVSFRNVWSSYKNYMVSFRNAWSSPGKLWLSCFRKVSVFASEFSFSR